VRMQVQDAKRRLGTLRPQETYSGPLDVVRRVLRDEGVAGLYRGHAACVMREVPGNFAWFGVYEASVRWNQERLGCASREDVPLWVKGLCGSLGGVCYWVLPYPFDTAKTLLTCDQRFFGWSTRMVLRKVYQEQGARGLYKGLGVTIARAVPEHYLLFMIFEWADAALQRV